MNELKEQKVGWSNQTKCILAIGGAVLYVVCPLDGDFIPFLGWVDDAGVVALCVKYVSGLMAQKQEAVNNIRGKKPAATIKVVRPVEDEIVDVEFEKAS